MEIPIFEWNEEALNTLPPIQLLTNQESMLNEKRNSERLVGGGFVEDKQDVLYIWRSQLLKKSQCSESKQAYLDIGMTFWNSDIKRCRRIFLPASPCQNGIFLSRTLLICLTVLGEIYFIEEPFENKRANFTPQKFFDVIPTYCHWESLTSNFWIGFEDGKVKQFHGLNELISFEPFSGSWSKWFQVRPNEHSEVLSFSLNTKYLGTIYKNGEFKLFSRHFGKLLGSILIEKDEMSSALFFSVHDNAFELILKVETTDGHAVYKRVRVACSDDLPKVASEISYYKYEDTDHFYQLKGCIQTKGSDTLSAWWNDTHKESIVRIDSRKLHLFDYHENAVIPKDHFSIKSFFHSLKGSYSMSQLHIAIEKSFKVKNIEEAIDFVQKLEDSYVDSYLRSFLEKLSRTWKEDQEIIGVFNGLAGGVCSLLRRKGASMILLNVPDLSQAKRLNLELYHEWKATNIDPKLFKSNNVKPIQYPELIDDWRHFRQHWHKSDVIEIEFSSQQRKTKINPVLLISLMKYHLTAIERALVTFLLLFSTCEVYSEDIEDIVIDIDHKLGFIRNIKHCLNQFPLSTSRVKRKQVDFLFENMFLPEEKEHFSFPPSSISLDVEYNNLLWEWSNTVDFVMFDNDWNQFWSRVAETAVFMFSPHSLDISTSITWLLLSKLEDLDILDQICNFILERNENLNNLRCFLIIKGCVSTCMCDLVEAKKWFLRGTPTIKQDEYFSAVGRFFECKNVPELALFFLKLVKDSNEESLRKIFDNSIRCHDYLTSLTSVVEIKNQECQGDLLFRLLGHLVKEKQHSMLLSLPLENSPNLLYLTRVKLDDFIEEVAAEAFLPMFSFYLKNCFYESAAKIAFRRYRLLQKLTPRSFDDEFSALSLCLSCYNQSPNAFPIIDKQDSFLVSVSKLELHKSLVLVRSQVFLQELFEKYRILQLIPLYPNQVFEKLLFLLDQEKWNADDLLRITFDLGTLWNLNLNGLFSIIGRRYSLFTDTFKAFFRDYAATQRITLHSVQIAFRSFLKHNQVIKIEEWWFEWFYNNEGADLYLDILSENGYWLSATKTASQVLKNSNQFCSAKTFDKIISRADRFSFGSQECKFVVDVKTTQDHNELKTLLKNLKGELSNYFIKNAKKTNNAA